MKLILLHCIKKKVGWLVSILTFVCISFNVNAENTRLLSDSTAINNKIDGYLQLSSILSNSNLDSAMYYAELANQLIESVETDSAKIEIFKALGGVYVARGNFALSLGYYFKAKELIDNGFNADPNKIELIEGQIDILNKMGVVFFSQKNLDQSLQYYNDALLILEKFKEALPESYLKYKISLLNNIAGVHIQRDEYDIAREYYSSALETNATKNNEKIEATLSNNIGICYMENRDFSLANVYFQRALKIRQRIGDKRGEAQCYNNIGKNYVYNSNFSEAKKYYLEALYLGREMGSKESVSITLQSLSSIYDTLKDYRNAFTTLKEFKLINDSLFNTESINKIAQLEMKYEFDKQEKLFELELKRREAEKQKAELLYLVAGSTLFFLLITAILLIFLQRSKIRNSKLIKEKLELEQKQSLLEKQKLKEDLEFKNKELTTNVMYLLKKNELITGISERLIKSKLDFKVENQKIIQEIINELRSTQDRDVWSEFETHFTQVHIDFYKKLNEKFPNLSSNEKKLCAFLRLNMSTKDISAITYQSVNSITVARSRLRTKLNISGEEVNLINFLMQL